MNVEALMASKRSSFEEYSDTMRLRRPERVTTVMEMKTRPEQSFYALTGMIWNHLRL